MCMPLFFMFLYNALVVPMVIAFLSIAVLWRSQRATQTRPPTEPGRGPQLVERSA